MKQEIQYFDITPKIVPAGTTVEVRIEPIFGHTQFDSSSRYVITYKPMEDFGAFSSFNDSRLIVPRFDNSALVFDVTLDGEQEHSLLLEREADTGKTVVGDFRMYSLADDLFTRRPFKGDLHIHSNRSDGREEPGYVAASCRKIGLDFMAVTDQRRYDPSIEAQKAFAGLNIDLRIYRGEEVHPPENPIHIINFGGTESVNDMFSSPSYRREVNSIQDKLKDLPEDLDPYFFASSLWCFEKIRQVGGLSIFCHPYWISSNRYHIPGSLTSKLFEDKPFDAYELIGGYHADEVESNMLQVLRYQEELVRGVNLPVVGVSDAHGCDRESLFGWYYTIVFSPSVELTDVTSSIRENYSVAVEHLPNTTLRVHGPYRLAKFAHFFAREMMPRHDALCRNDGEIMLEHLGGNPDIAEKFAQVSGRSAKYVDECYARRLSK